MMNLRLVATRLAIRSLAVLVFVSGAPLSAQRVEQDRLVAAMAARIMSFVEISRSPERSEPVVIGVFDDEELFAILNELLQEEAYVSRLSAVPIEANVSLEELARTHAILFSGDNRRDLPEVIRNIGEMPILLMGAFDGFLEQGGMLNFIKRQNRITFEVHVGRANARGIEFRSELLRLASRVVEKQ